MVLAYVARCVDGALQPYHAAALQLCWLLFVLCRLETMFFCLIARLYCRVDTLTDLSLISFIAVDSTVLVFSQCFNVVLASDEHVLQWMSMQLTLQSEHKTVLLHFDQCHV